MAVYVWTCRNAAIRKFANSDFVTFGDVDLSEENIRGIHTPGWGGWYVLSGVAYMYRILTISYLYLV
jgi:hypothetical protein